ncbi:hypothetical protein TI39_contig5838g00004 [Zymoseptoria brevis]|uniref:Uncharacterized protein n=1 Tax=Zymoseptoria brevis TaxID=1047168 RepID=A0A0F4G5H7_9PEZI|nr:hypothetical protein TI39_contig5838g00004 [Zymoseptoria brevis]
MASHISNSNPRGNMQVFQDTKITRQGVPKSKHNKNKKPLKSSIKKMANGTRTGDAISDDSDGDDEGELSGSDEEDEEDDDDADVFALSGGPRIGSNANGRLAGPMSDDVDMFDDDQAVAGAERASTNDSDEEDYGAVDDMSDSDDSEPDVDENTVLRKAERDLIEEFESTEKPRAARAMASEMNGMNIEEDSGLSRRTSMQSETSMDGELDFGLDFTQDPFGGLNSHDSLYQELIEDAEGQFDSDLASWRIPDVHPDSLLMHSRSRESSIISTHTAKKVRFEETTSSRSRTSSLSSEDIDPREAYPDLLDSADTPIGRSNMVMLNMDGDVEMDQMETESLYDFDFEDEYEKAAFEIDRQSDSEESSSDDSEDGDTTDEDTPDDQAARLIAIQKASGRVPNTEQAPSTPTPRKGSTTKSTRRPTSGRFASSATRSDKRPKSGTFVHDPSVASVSATTKGSGVKLVCPTRPPEAERAYWDRARRAMGSRDGSPGASVSWTRTTPRTASIPQQPFTAKSTLGTMFDGNLDFLRSNDQSGIAEDLLKPSINRAVRGTYASAPPSDTEVTDNDSSSLNIDDFVQLDDSSDPPSDTEADVDDTELDETDADTESHTLSRPSTANLLSPQSSFSTSTGGNANFDSGLLLDHFDQQRGLVSSFRNNQHHARVVSSLAANPTKRAMTSQANALQKGRKNAAMAPMTPARKKRASADLGAVLAAGVRKGAAASPLARKGSLKGMGGARSRGNSLSQTLALERFVG